MENDLPLAVWVSALLSCLFVVMGLNKTNYFKRHDNSGPLLLMLVVMIVVSGFTLEVPVKSESLHVPVIAKHDKKAIYYFDAVDKENGILIQTDYCATNNPHPLGRTALIQHNEYNFIGYRLSSQYFYAP